MEGAASLSDPRGESEGQLVDAPVLHDQPQHLFGTLEDRDVLERVALDHQDVGKGTLLVLAEPDLPSAPPVSRTVVKPRCSIFRMLSGAAAARYQSVEFVAPPPPRGRVGRTTTWS